MDDAAKQALAEGAIFLIQYAFTNLMMAGKTSDEIDNIFAMEKAKFDARKVTDLPKPPE